MALITIKCPRCYTFHRVEGTLVASPRNKHCPVCRPIYDRRVKASNDAYNAAVSASGSSEPTVRDRLLAANELRTFPAMNFTSNVPAGTEVATTLPYKSKSSPGTVYECRLYTNGATSCNCPAWRFVKNGVRSCKHTRDMDTKKAGLLAALNGEALPVAATKHTSAPTRVGIRKFNFDA